MGLSSLQLEGGLLNPGFLQNQCGFRVCLAGDHLTCSTEKLGAEGCLHCPVFTSFIPTGDLGDGTGDLDSYSPGDFFYPSLSQCSRPFPGEQGGEATVCKPRGSFLLSKTFICSAQKAMSLSATSKPGIVHNPDLVSLYNGCYLYEGQFVNSTCSFNKRMFYKKKVQRPCFV